MLGAGQIALAAAPSVLKLGANLFGKDNPTDYEKKLSRMANIFEEKSTTPLTETSEFKSGKSILDRKDKKNKERMANLIGGGNVTNDAKLATMESTNDSYSAGLQGIMESARRIKDYNAQRYLQTLGMKEGATQNRIANKQNAVGAILEPAQNAVNTYLMSSLFDGSNK